MKNKELILKEAEVLQEMFGDNEHAMGQFIEMEGQVMREVVEANPDDDVYDLVDKINLRIHNETIL